jgi:hypothetical protein
VLFPSSYDLRLRSYSGVKRQTNLRTLCYRMCLRLAAEMAFCAVARPPSEIGQQLDESKRAASGGLYCSFFPVELRPTVTELQRCKASDESQDALLPHVSEACGRNGFVRCSAAAVRDRPAVGREQMCSQWRAILQFFFRRATTYGYGVTAA